jgi:hypothetical protein
VVHLGFDDYLQVFGEIQKIYVLSSSIKRVHFKIGSLHTEEFSSDYRTYIVRRHIHPQVHVIPQRSLQYFLPLHFVSPNGVNGELHILPKFDIYNPN